MSYRVLYRNYRPLAFNDVVGQKAIVQCLKNSITNNKVGHSYLFCGNKGTGKTTTARIFAKALNCLNFAGDVCNKCANCISFNEGKNVDIIEIDGASNNGVDDIRNIVENISYAPLNGKYKIFIIDEVHMLTKAAFNAFLKTLEEPPNHAVFLMATTEPNSILSTILSRVIRFNFQKIKNDDIVLRLKHILETEKLAYQEEVLDLIASIANGGLRDALSLLEQLIAYNSEYLSLEDALKVFSVLTKEELIALIVDIHKQNISSVIRKINEYDKQGINLKICANMLLKYILETIIFLKTSDASLLEELDEISVKQLLDNVDGNQLLGESSKLIELLNINENINNYVAFFELCLLKMIPEKTVKSQENTKVIECAVTDKEEVKPIIKEENTTKKVYASSGINPNIIDDEFLLSVLLTAEKTLKINDQIIYNKLELDKENPDYKKFYNVLSKSELLASNNDIMIIKASKDIAEDINEDFMNSELFRYTCIRHNIKKSMIAITNSEFSALINMYQENKDNQERIEKAKSTNFIRYQHKKEKSTKDILSDFFGEDIEIYE